MTAATTTSGLALVAGHFEAPPFIVPNAKGEAFKIEQVVERSPGRTAKLVWWFGPDDDRDPHNHPWPFDSEILAGGYTSVVYWLEDGKVRPPPSVSGSCRLTAEPGSAPRRKTAARCRPGSSGGVTASRRLRRRGGPSVQIVDLELLQRTTRELKPWRVRHILEELRTAARR